MNIIKKYWVVIVLLISSLAIISALLAEYVFNILPCKMCLYQRYPYYILIIISFIYIILKKLPLTWYYWICSLFFSIGLFFSVWHVGIEQKILPGLPGCTFTINASQSLKDLKEQILNQGIINCHGPGPNVVMISSYLESCLRLTANKRTCRCTTRDCSE